MVRHIFALVVVVGLVMASQRPVAAKEPAANGGDSTNKARQFDTDGDGKLSPAEKAAAKSNPEGKPGRQDLEALLRKFDANGNGKLDPDERLKAKEAAKQYRDKIEASRAAAAAGQTVQPAQAVRRGAPAGQNGQGNAQQFPGAKGNQFPGGRPTVARPGQPGTVNRPAKK